MSESFLIVASGDSAGTEIEIGNELVLGRSGVGVGRIEGDAEISRQHARVTRRDGDELIVEDLGSTNGTFVNGLRIDEPRTLAVGDLLRVGRTELELRGRDDTPEESPAVHYEEESPAAAAPHPEESPAAVAPYPEESPSEAAEYPDESHAAAAPYREEGPLPAAQSPQESPAPAAPYWIQAGEYTYGLAVEERLVALVYWTSGRAGESDEGDGDQAAFDQGWYWLSVEAPESHYPVAEGIELSAEMSYEELQTATEDALEIAEREILADEGDAW